MELTFTALSHVLDTLLSTPPGCVTSTLIGTWRARDQCTHFTEATEALRGTASDPSLELVSVELGFSQQSA